MDLSRYVDATELQFTVEFITPAFLGGANGNAEIRTAPFKHGIRYWWRILYGAKYCKIGKLKETEDRIFGSAGGKTDAHKSNMQVRIDNKPNGYAEKTGFPNGKKISVEHNGKPMSVNILDYLAYGKFDYVKGSGNVYNVSHIRPGTRMTLTISIRKDEYVSEIKNAALMFFKYGTVGSRSRNGFGAMNIIDCSEKNSSETVKFSKDVKVSEELLEFPILSSKTQFYSMKHPCSKWEDALSEIGIFYKKARCSLERRHTYTRRGFVARPIEVKNENIPGNIKSGRIPKPFYMGVVKNKNGYIGYIISLPIKFYESGSQNEYINVVAEMNKYFNSTMNNATADFLSQFIGGAK